jgi:hypothetical protein
MRMKPATAPPRYYRRPRGARWQVPLAAAGSLEPMPQLSAAGIALRRRERPVGCNASGYLPPLSDGPGPQSSVHGTPGPHPPLGVSNGQLMCRDFTGGVPTELSPNRRSSRCGHSWWDELFATAIPRDDLSIRAVNFRLARDWTGTEEMPTAWAAA